MFLFSRVSTRSRLATANDDRPCAQWTRKICAFNGAAAGKFYGQGGLRCVFKGSSPDILSARRSEMQGGREGVAFAWDLARPPGTPASRWRGFLHGRMCCLAVVLSAVFLMRGGRFVQINVDYCLRTPHSSAIRAAHNALPLPTPLPSSPELTAGGSQIGASTIIQ